MPTLTAITAQDIRTLDAIIARVETLQVKLSRRAHTGDKARRVHEHVAAAKREMMFALREAQQ